MTATLTTTWRLHRLGRVDDADGEDCRCALQKHQHRACYRAHWVHTGTGEIGTRHHCTNRAAALAGEHGLAFPPGRWTRPA
ncbi:MAG: hypothetical protein H0W72_16305 [Planctomycetes bacterium]|nr:hypothetical protein [Planctomycetota bacterium]